jgi:pimeloyl-ACP methyl ester carboxylesterase
MEATLKNFARSAAARSGVPTRRRKSRFVVAAWIVMVFTLAAAACLVPAAFAQGAPGVPGRGKGGGVKPAPAVTTAQGGVVKPAPAVTTAQTGSSATTLLITFDGGYQPGSLNLFNNLASLGYGVTHLYNPLPGAIAAALSAGTYQQVWLFDITTSLQISSSDATSIAAWYVAHAKGNIVIDARSYGSYFQPAAELPLTANYARGFGDRCGGLWLGSDDAPEWATNVNTVLRSIGYAPVTGTQDSVVVGSPVPSAELLTYPNRLDLQTIDAEATPGIAPAGPQPDGTNLQVLLSNAASADQPLATYALGSNYCNQSDPSSSVVYVAGIASTGGNLVTTDAPMWLNNYLTQAAGITSRAYFSYSNKWLDGGTGENGATPNYDTPSTCTDLVTESGYLKALVQRVAGVSRGRVTLIAHSQGGLIAANMVGALGQGTAEDQAFLRERIGSVVTFDSFPGGMADWQVGSAQRLFSWFLPTCSVASANYARWTTGIPFTNVAITAGALVPFYTLAGTAPDSIGGAPTLGDGVTKIPGERAHMSVGGASHASIWQDGSPAAALPKQIFVACAVQATGACKTLDVLTQPLQITRTPFSLGSTNSLDVGWSWPGSTVTLALIDPNGTRIDPSHLPSGATYDVGPTWGRYRLPTAAAGAWQAEVFGADVAASGEDTTLEISQAPLPEPILLTNPVRLADTRTGSGAIGSGASQCFTVAGVGGVPGDAAAVVLNVTAVGQTINGWLTVYPKGQPVPATSTLNFGTSEYAIANGTVMRIGDGGQVCVNVGTVNSAPGSAQVILDVTGYLTSAALTQAPMLMSPQRLVDTRAVGGPIATGSSRCFQVAGVRQIPADAAAVVINLTGVGYTNPGWLTAYPAGQPVPATSTLNFDTAEYAMANGTIIRIGDGGQVCVNVGTVNSLPGGTQVIIDTTGYLTSQELTQVPMLTSKRRLVDTRATGGPIATGESRCFQVTGVDGIPSNATGIVANLTAVGYGTKGWLTAYPSGLPAPATSTVNFDTTEYAMANGTLIGLGSDGQLCVSIGTINSAPGSAQVVLDVVGYLMP